MPIVTTPDPDEALWEALREENRLAQAAEGKPQRGPMSRAEQAEEEQVIFAIARIMRWVLEAAEEKDRD